MSYAGHLKSSPDASEPMKLLTPLSIDIRPAGKPAQPRQDDHTRTDRREREREDPERWDGMG